MASLILGTSCTWVAQRKALADCDFSLNGVALKNMDFTGFTVELRLNAKNPNTVDAVLDRLDYTLFMEGMEVARGTVSEKQTIPAKGHGIIRTSLTVKYSTVPKLREVVLPALNKRKSRVKVLGTVHFDTPIGTISQDIQLQRTVRLE